MDSQKKDFADLDWILALHRACYPIFRKLQSKCHQEWQLLTPSTVLLRPWMNSLFPLILAAIPSVHPRNPRTSLKEGQRSSLGGAGKHMRLPGPPCCPVPDPGQAELLVDLGLLPKDVHLQCF